MEQASRFQGTYWGGNGMYQAQAERMSELLNPFILEGKEPPAGSLLDLYDKTQAAYYDLHNNSMINGQLSLPPLASLLVALKNSAPGHAFTPATQAAINTLLSFHDDFMEAEALGEKLGSDRLDEIEWPNNELIRRPLETLLNFVLELSVKGINPLSKYDLGAHLKSSK